MLMGHALRQTFWLERLVRTNARGEHEYAEPELHPCRYEGATKRLVTADGSDRVSEAVMWTRVEVKPEDRVYPPGTSPDDYNAGREPLRCSPRHALSGEVDHYEVYL
ncbi:hypothetical protein BHS06_14850 [Myxococcus xanthus]|nr:hypothetical protein BHS06_14850 [Myxococcus xanthus]